jgi:hypothetical protein
MLLKGTSAIYFLIYRCTNLSGESTTTKTLKQNGNHVKMLLTFSQVVINNENIAQVCDKIWSREIRNIQQPQT